MSATIIVENDTCSGEYAMFDVRSIDDQGAVLCGPLFLEIGEPLRLRLARGEQTHELQARVQSVAREEELMTVLFVDLDASAKAFLAAEDVSKDAAKDVSKDVSKDAAKD